MPGSAPTCHLPGDGRAEAHLGGRADQPDLDLEGAGDRVRLRRHLAHPADRPDVAVEGQEDLDLGVGRSAVHDLRRHVEDRVAAVLACHAVNHLAGLDDLAGLGAARGDRAGAVGMELGPAQPVLGDVELGLGGVDPRLDRLQRLARLVVADPGRPAVPQQGLLALVVVRGLDQLPLGGRELGARRAQGVLVVLGVEPGDDLTGIDLIADVHQPLDQPPADAEPEVDLVLRLDGAGQRDGLAAAQLLDRHDANRADLRGGRLLLGAACGEEQARQRAQGTGEGGRHGPVGSGRYRHCQDLHRQLALRR